MPRSPAAFFLFACSAIAMASVAAAARSAILYGPDSLVDGDTASSYVEPAITADRYDAKMLVAAAESGGFSSPPQAFISHDGGYDWQTAPLLLGGGSLLGDVQLATAPDGAVYFASLGYQNAREGIQFFTLDRKGGWFNRTVFVQNYRGHGFDHEQLSIDGSRGSHRGRIYMSVLFAARLQPQLNACGLLWSSDRGRHFHGPVSVVDGWCFNSRPAVLSDGTVIFPFYISGKPGASGAPNDSIRRDSVEIAVSRDGGKSFTPPRAVGTYVWLGLANFKRRIAKGETDFDGDPVPQFIVGRSPLTGRDVIYGAWSDMRTGNSRLLFTRSTDEGRHWSKPVAILASTDAGDAQYQVSMDVSNRGVLGVAYLQYSSATHGVTEMFSDSSDDGVTFSKPVAIQSIPANLGFPRNSSYSPISDRLPSSRLKGSIMVGFTDPGQRFSSGGDYVGICVDADGAFHPIWADDRTGTYQVWTASTSVGSPPSVPPELLSADVTSSIELQFGTSTWDKKRRILSVPVRLHNVGSEALYPPFTVAVLNLANPLVPASWSPRAPVLVNADNGRHGVGAVYKYGARTLGNLKALEPGAETVSRIWNIGMSGNNPAIVVRVSGYKSR